MIELSCCFFLYLELKSRKDNFNQIMPDLEINTRSNPFGDQEKNFDQISVSILFFNEIKLENNSIELFLVDFGRSITIDDTKC